MYLVTVRCPSFDYVYNVGVLGLFESLDDANDAITIRKILNDMDQKLNNGYQFCDRCNTLFNPKYRNHACMDVIINDPYEDKTYRYFWEYLCDDCLPLSH